MAKEGGPGGDGIERLAPIFDLPLKPKQRSFKDIRTTPRYAHLPAT
jgi:hypothetical protein